MDAEKVRQLEARLREMLEIKEPDAAKPEEVRMTAPGKKVIIRRRKGQRDKRIALD